jgi:membrane associated rhomboid family serine protease
MTDLRLRNSIIITTAFIALLYLLKTIEVWSGLGLQAYGVYPQQTANLVGIVLAPLIHGSWQHLVANTLPLMILGTLVVYGYPKSRWHSLALIWLFSGVGVWLFARPSYHFGASGLTHGMLFFLFVVGIMRRDKRSIALLMIAFFMYGGMLLSIFPRQEGISWEYHFFGGLGGVLAAMMFGHWDTKPVEKLYSWEVDDEVEDPVIGDLWQQTDNSDDVNNNEELKKD